MPDRRPAILGHLFLSLDGEFTVLKSFGGGNIEGAVASIPTGTGGPPHKQITALKLEPFTIGFGLSMGSPLYEWIRGTLDHTSPRRSGAVIIADADYRVIGRRDFRDALLTELTIPALDASGREPGIFRLQFQAEAITCRNGDGSTLRGIFSADRNPWLASNFRFRLGDLPCNRVSGIESFAIRQKLNPVEVGGFRISAARTTELAISDLKITFPAADVQPWAAWFDEFVIKGVNGQDKELAGSIEFLDPTGQNILGSVELRQVGIFSFKAEPSAAAPDGVSRYTAELYVENMNFNLAAL